jgi:hypothetical protein
MCASTLVIAGLGRLIDPAGAGPAAVAKRGRLIFIVMAIEEYERLRAWEGETRPASRANCTGKASRNKAGG